MEVAASKTNGEELRVDGSHWNRVWALEEGLQRNQPGVFYP
jgi:hypothetical protein